MATPEYVPESPLVRVRVTDFAGISPPRRRPPRPVEMLVPAEESGFGVPCPDAGYGFLLGHEFDPRLVVDPAENREDAHWAAATLGVRRAGRAGRAPQADDFDVGQALLGYDGTAPEWFVAWRRTRLQGISRDADLGQWLADRADEGVGVADVPPRDELMRWWTQLAPTTPPPPVHVRPPSTEGG